jgi:hypothetical protein
MKKELWLPAVIFLIASIPTVVMLQHFKIGGDYVLLLAMGVGVLASTFFMPKNRPPEDK